MAKSILRSKTIWWNLLGGLAVVLTHAADMLPAEWGAVVLAVGNLLLRYVTTQPVALKLP